MTDKQIKHMVRQFLRWRLPKGFSPDAGISFKKTFNEHTAHPMEHEPVGTNLFDYTQAEAMVRYMLEGLPVPSPEAPTGSGVPDGEGPTYERAAKDLAMMLKRICWHIGKRSVNDDALTGLAHGAMQLIERWGLMGSSLRDETPFKNLAAAPQPPEVPTGREWKPTREAIARVIARAVHGDDNQITMGSGSIDLGPGGATMIVHERAWQRYTHIADAILALTPPAQAQEDPAHD